MGAVRARIPEKETAPVRAAGYVRISAQQHLHSASQQKDAIRRYAQNHNLYISLIRSEQRQL